VGTAKPSVREETSFLHDVTSDMLKRGILPERIVGIILELREPEVREALAAAAYNSPSWKAHNSAAADDVVVALLNSIGSYNQFNSVFDGYGLMVEVSSAEHIETTSPQSIGLRPKGIMNLPIGATLELAVHKKGESR
jgi:hypothetical protein